MGLWRIIHGGSPSGQLHSNHEQPERSMTFEVWILGIDAEQLFLNIAQIFSILRR
jgi:hypothetical protein